MRSPRRTAEFFAPAKVNLTLHVTGQRADGYHHLDALVVFADVGDRVRVTPAAEMSLRVTGPQAVGVPTDRSNLVWRAANWFGTPPVAIELEKHLPSAAGLGGGSSDAAATLRALAACFGRDLPAPSALADLGADVPACLGAATCRMSGIGEVVVPMPGLPMLHMVLVNPGVAVPTPAVFAALTVRKNDPMAELPGWSDAKALANWLRTQRNDLEPSAIGIAPEIGDVRAALARTDGCQLARMSGSGGTCFGLYPTRSNAGAAAAAIADLHGDWWVRPVSTLQHPV